MNTCQPSLTLWTGVRNREVTQQGGEMSSLDSIDDVAEMVVTPCTENSATAGHSSPHPVNQCVNTVYNDYCRTILLRDVQPVNR